LRFCVGSPIMVVIDWNM